MQLSFRDISHYFGSERVLNNVNLTIKGGEVLTLLGPSGSGKSTILRIAAGLENIQKGALFIDDTILADKDNHPPPEDRSVGLVFQDHVLYPHMTVFQNLAFGLDHLDKTSKRVRVEEYLSLIKMIEFADRYPDTLSGGQQQRVGLARSLARKPKIMLLDEPFGSVDLVLRRELRETTRSILKDSNCCTIMVTHDPDEALEMSDNIAIIKAGQLSQVGSVDDLLNKPLTKDVAMSFAGGQSLLGTRHNNIVYTSCGTLDYQSNTKGSSVNVIARPIGVVISNEQNQKSNPAVILDIRPDGMGVNVLLKVSDKSVRSFLPLSAIENGMRFKIGDQVHVCLDPRSCFVFSD
ncbi:MAG: hypothetical protein CMM25_04135 [Rhodospirillaceae bacterium]|nr:hypothetical protein [Rhodospirillaceae bacterium]